MWLGVNPADTMLLNMQITYSSKYIGVTTAH